jgi:hypothetical protein
MIKSFKIGEYAVGGIIRVQTDKDVITIQALDYVTKQPIMEDRFHTERSGYLNQIDHFLFNLTTSYYTDKIMTYIKSIAPKN